MGVLADRLAKLMAEKDGAAEKVEPVRPRKSSVAETAAPEVVKKTRGRPKKEKVLTKTEMQARWRAKKKETRA